MTGIADAPTTAFCAVARLIGRNLCAAGIFALAPVWPDGMAARAAEIVISWTQVQQQVRPRPGIFRANKSVRLNLQGGNAVSEQRTITNRFGQTKEHKAGGQFRGSMKLGNDLQSSWQVQDSRTLVRTENLLQHVETMRVTTTSANACEADISYKLKPGFSEYRLWSIRRHEATFHKSMSAEQISCRVVAQ